MELYYTITQSDYIEFNKYNLLNRPSASQKSAEKGYPFVLPFLLIILGICFCILLQTRLFLLIYLIISVIASAIWIPNSKKIYKNSLIKSTLKAIEGGSGVEFLGEYSLVLDAYCLRQKHNNVLTETPYTNIQNVAIDLNCIYLFTGSISAVVIPKRAFYSAEQMNYFLSIITSKNTPQNYM